MSNIHIIFQNKTVQQSVQILTGLEQYCKIIEHVSPSTKSFIKAHIDKIKFFVDTADFDNISERTDAKLAINVIKHFNQFYSA